MSINVTTIAPISATIISIAGLIFHLGKNSEKLDILGNTVYAQEVKVNENHKYINEMKVFMSRYDEKIDDVNNNIKDIKVKLDKLDDKIHR